MIISGEFVSERIVTQTLLAKLRHVQPIGELNDVLFAGFRGRGFVVADTQENWKIAERSDLAADKVVPSGLFIIINAKRIGKVFGAVLHVFIEIIDRTVIAQVPVKA